MNIREGYKKVPLSRRVTPDTGSGRINAPHGGRYYRYCGTAIKKANPARVGEHPSPVSNVTHCKGRDCFWKSKGKGRDFFSHDIKNRTFSWEMILISVSLRRVTGECCSIICLTAHKRKEAYEIQRAGKKTPESGLYGS